MDEARDAAQAMLNVHPGFTLAFARNEMAQFNGAYRERRLASLRAAGIPEG
jgi:hypothetical protein